MNEWEDRIQKQDRGLDELHKGVKNLKYELDMIDMGDKVIAVPVGDGSDDIPGVFKLNKSVFTI